MNIWIYCFVKVCMHFHFLLIQSLCLSWLIGSQRHLWWIVWTSSGSCLNNNSEKIFTFSSRLPNWWNRYLRDTLQTVMRSEWQSWIKTHFNEIYQIRLKCAFIYKWKNQYLHRSHMDFYYNFAEKNKIQILFNSKIFFT